LKQDRFSKPSSATNKPVVAASGDRKVKRNEVFIDLLERLTVLFNASGQIMRCEVDGSIQMKSYLSGQPEIKLGLNQEIVVGKGSTTGLCSSAVRRLKKNKKLFHRLRRRAAR